MVGWRYTLRIPSWSQVQLQDGETVVFFQVEVTVLPPEDGPPRKRSVGRRYSNFVTLYQRLREEVGQRMLVGLEPPPKRSFSGVNKKPELIERRRWELEQWLWRLTEVPQIANSAMMFHFCELAEASRLSTRARPPLSPSASAAAEQSSALPSYAPSWSGSELSDHVEGVAEGEGNAEPPGAASAHGLRAHAATAGHTSSHPALQQQPGGRHHQGPPQQHPPLQRDSVTRLQPSPSGSSSADSGAGGSTSLSALLHTAASAPVAPSSAASGEIVAGAGGRIRLGLQVEHRAAIRGLARTLRSQLEQAAADIQDAARTIQSDQQAIAQLAAQAQELQDSHSARSDGAQPPLPWEGSPEQQRALAELQAERERSEGLFAELQREQERAQSVAAQLAAAKEVAAAQEDAARQEREAREAATGALRQQLEEALARQQQLQEQAQVSAAQPAQAGEGSRLDAAVPELQGRLQALDGELAQTQRQLAEERGAKEELAARAGVLEAAAAKAVAEQEEAVAKSRADLKVLAREIKGLRSKLEAEQQRSAELEQQLAAAQAAVAGSAAQQQQKQNGVGPAAGPHGELVVAGTGAADAEMAGVLRTVAALHAMLGECRVDAQPGQHPAPSPTTLAQLLGCERRVQALMDRVRRELLPQGGGARAEEAGAMATPGLLRSACGGLLLDAAEARRRYYELLRSTLAVSAHLEGLEQRVGTPSGTPVSSPTKLSASAEVPGPLQQQQQQGVAAPAGPDNQ